MLYHRNKRQAGFICSTLHKLRAAADVTGFPVFHLYRLLAVDVFSGNYITYNHTKCIIII